MMPFGNMPDVPPPSELWKEEKVKFRPWMILFVVSILTIFALYLAAFVWNIIEQDTFKAPLIDSLASQIRQTTVNGVQVDAATALNNAQYAIDTWYNTWVLGIAGATTAVIFLAVIWFGFSLYESYRAKTFEKISRGVSTITSIAACLAGVELLSMIFRRQPDAQFPGGIILIVARVLLVVAALSVFSVVFRIRRAFFVSRQMNELKASPEYQAMQKQAAAGQATPQGFNAPMMGPFGLIVPPTANSGPSGANGAGSVPLAAATAVPQSVQDLNALELEDLVTIAKRLSISGHEVMSREQLIENIIRVTPATSEETKALQRQDREVELKAMSLLELRKIAKKLSISGHQKMTKDELIASIMRVSASS